MDGKGKTLESLPHCVLRCRYLDDHRPAPIPHCESNDTNKEKHFRSIVRPDNLPRWVVEGGSSCGWTPSNSMCSPSFSFCAPPNISIADNKFFRDALFRAHRRKVLCLITIDEAHLYAMHRQTFWEMIRVLKLSFFEDFLGRGGYKPLFLIMTATMNKSLLAALADLTCVEWTDKCRHMWWLPSEFRQRYIKMVFEATSEIGQKTLPPVVTHVTSNKNSCLCL